MITRVLLRKLIARLKVMKIVLKEFSDLIKTTIVLKLKGRGKTKTVFTNLKALQTIIQMSQVLSKK